MVPRVLGPALEAAVEQGLIESNPVDGVEVKRLPAEGHSFIRTYSEWPRDGWDRFLLDVRRAQQKGEVGDGG